MKEVILNHCKIVESALAAYGFKETEAGYTHSEIISGGQFELNLLVTGDGKVYSRLIETGINEEYVLHLVPDAQGEFVGKVKCEYAAAIERFKKNCCEKDVFQGWQARAVIEYARNTYGDELQFLWEKFSQNAVLRRKDTQCWYGVLLTVSRRKLGFNSDETATVLDLRMPPEAADKTIDYKSYFPGYHMNKKHWLTVVLDGSVATEEIYKKIDESYRLAAKTAKKTVKRS